MRSRRRNPKSKSAAWQSRLDLPTSLSILDSIATLTGTTPTQADHLRRLGHSLVDCSDADRNRKLSSSISQAFSEIATSLLSRDPSLHSQQPITKSFHNDIDTLKIIHTSFGLSNKSPVMHPDGLFCLANGNPVDVESYGRAVAEEFASMVAKLHAESDAGKGGAGTHDSTTQQPYTGPVDETATSPVEQQDCIRHSGVRSWRRRFFSRGTGGEPTLTNRNGTQASLGNWRTRLLSPTLRSPRSISAHQHTAPTEVPNATAGEDVTSISSQKPKRWRQRRRGESGPSATKTTDSRSNSSIDAWLESTVGSDTAPPTVLGPPPIIETDQTRAGGIGSVLLGSAVIGGIIWAGARYLGYRDDDA